MQKETNSKTTETTLGVNIFWSVPKIPVTAHAVSNRLPINADVYMVDILNPTLEMIPIRLTVDGPKTTGSLCPARISIRVKTAPRKKASGGKWSSLLRFQNGRTRQSSPG
jgi:hypothetical protein